MSYIDALYERDKDRILVVERNEQGERVYKEFPAEYIFYYTDRKGKYRTIYDTPVSKFSTRSYKEFAKEVRMHGRDKVWESDIKPVFRCLEEHYAGKKSPKLHTAFFDIETDFHADKGFAGPEDPFNAITAISVYLDWMQQLITLVIAPRHMNQSIAADICAKFENTILCSSEIEMLQMFLEIIDDADVLSGWNSEGFDIPYTVMRINKILSKDDTRRFCLWDQYPKRRDFERYGAEQMTFDLIGRVHLDYMQLYRKYTYEERHSYSLDAIAEYELGERKTQYEGTLDQLYNNDFETFITYNRQDTMLLARLDEKLKFLDLANELAHDNGVLLPTTMGAVAVTEQAIILESHRRGMVVPSRKPKDFSKPISDDMMEDDDDDRPHYSLDDDDEGNLFSDTQAAGAYVAVPKAGMHKWIGAIDINSLYPSTIRALNMGPETVIGQLRPIMTDSYINEQMKDKKVGKRMMKGSSFAEAWDGLFGTLEYTAVMDRDPSVEVTIDWENGTEPTVVRASDVWELVFNSGQPWCISGNGTIFTYERKGIVPGLLERWYAERKEMQKKKKEATEKADIEFWDKRQLVKKINLNSLYGAILNPGCRFFDQRIGQSTTLTGRLIARHMDAYINQAVTGVYDHTGEAIVYGDTDSCYFSVWPVIKDDVKSGKQEWDKDICITVYDSIADQVNESFPAFMEQACHATKEHGELIKGGRELIASTGLYIKKKRYAVLIYDMEGDRLDLYDEEKAKKKGILPGLGKIKAMGLDLKRADTPKLVQDFLIDILKDVLTGAKKEEIYDKTREFKYYFKDLNPWDKGTPKRVNNLTRYRKAEERQGKTRMPGHVRAALNWNRLKELYNDQHSNKIVDGMKVIVCKLKDNPMGFVSVAYPTDILHIPQWFKDLPFDDDLMETTIVDKKTENLLGVLNWEVAKNTQIKTNFDSLFSFE